MTVGHLDGLEYYTGLIKRGYRDGYVFDIQHFFNYLGYKLKPDGIFGNMTMYVVKDFQRHSELKPDGVIGEKTKSKMFYYDGAESKVYCPEVFEQILGNREKVDCYNLEKYCLTKKLSGLSWAFEDAERSYGVNILHNIAHAILESASGTSFIARLKNNLYGFRAYDSSPVASAGRFRDYPDCINTWTGWWVENYLLPDGKYFNGNHEYGVNKKYASSGIAGVNKAFIVQLLRAKINQI